MEYPIKVKILGTEYTIEKHSCKEDEGLGGLGGYCSLYIPLIVVCDLDSRDDFKDGKQEVKEAVEKQTLRHEIIHAFLNESGIKESSCVPNVGWSQNEEMVDWMASQFHKIQKIYEEIGCL